MGLLRVRFVSNADPLRPRLALVRISAGGRFLRISFPQASAGEASQKRSAAGVSSRFFRRTSTCRIACSGSTGRSVILSVLRPATDPSAQRSDR